MFDWVLNRSLFFLTTWADKVKYTNITLQEMLCVKSEQKILL